MSRISDELQEINQEKKETIKKTTKKLDKVPKKVTKEVISDRQSDTIEFYNSLSETEKLIFNKELQKKFFPYFSEYIKEKIRNDS